MAENSRSASWSCDHDCEEYPQNLRDEATAALTLCTMRNAQLSNEEAIVQENMHCQLVSSDHTKLRSIQDKFPPVQTLYGLVGECSEPYEKELTITDLKPDQNRFHISKEFAKKSLEPMLHEDENLKLGIEATTYDSEGKEHGQMVFKLWAKKSHVLNKGWNQFCRSQGFVPDESVTLWMFRHLLTKKLCFVIIRTKPKVPTADKKTRCNMSANQECLKIKKQRKEETRTN